MKEGRDQPIRHQAGQRESRYDPGQHRQPRHASALQRLRRFTFWRIGMRRTDLLTLLVRHNLSSVDRQVGKGAQAQVNPGSAGSAICAAQVSINESGAINKGTPK